MADDDQQHFTESDSSDDEPLDCGSRKTLTSKVSKESFNPEDEGPFGSNLGEKPPRKGLEWESVETYNLKQIDDDDLTKRLQDHARDFMSVGGLKFPAGMKQKIPAWNTGNCRAKNFKVLIRPPWYVNFIYTFTILHFF
jgi:hypothetical protein